MYTYSSTVYYIHTVGRICGDVDRALDALVCSRQLIGAVYIHTHMPTYGMFYIFFYFCIVLHIVL